MDNNKVPVPLVCQTDPGVGWYLDDIRLQNVTRVAEESGVKTTSTNRLTFSPTTKGNYLLTTRTVIFGHHPLEWTPLKALKVQ